MINHKFVFLNFFNLKSIGPGFTKAHLQSYGKYFYAMEVTK